MIWRHHINSWGSHRTAWGACNVVVRTGDLTVLGLAAGTGMLEGGVGIALEAIGLRAKPVGYVEREASAAASLVARMEKTGLDFAPIWDDLATFDGSAWRGSVDIITAGYPCQPFSLAGKRRGERDDRNLWRSVCRTIAAIQPGLVFLENVPGHLSLGFNEVHEDLCKLGYEVTAGLFSAEEVGANQRRERLFILGVRSRKRGQQIAGSASRNESSNEGRKSEDYHFFASTNQGLADGVRAGLEKRSSERCDTESQQAPSQRSSGELADAQQSGSRAGIQGKQGPAIRQRRDRLADYRDGLPIFAPARNDFRSWTFTASVAPTLMPATEPELRGVADGMVSRSDRLRLVGNGVVALAAAYAFLSLFACLGATICEQGPTPSKQRS